MYGFYPFFCCSYPFFFVVVVVVVGHLCKRSWKKETNWGGYCFFTHFLILEAMARVFFPSKNVFMREIASFAPATFSSKIRW